MSVSATAHSLVLGEGERHVEPSKLLQPEAVLPRNGCEVSSAS